MTGLAELLAEAEGLMASAFAPVEWAEDEIAQACRRHPGSADLLYHGFGLMPPGAFPVEFVYRGHARELLERIAAGQDTRPATAAEVCLVCAKTSQLAPFHTSGVGLYMRMWAQAFPGHPVHDGQDDDQVHYEALRSSQIDELEALVRRRAAQPWRVLPTECAGRHHGRTVACRLARPAGPATLFDLAEVA